MFSYLTSLLYRFQSKPVRTVEHTIPGNPVVEADHEFVVTTLGWDLDRAVTRLGMGVIVLLVRHRRRAEA